MPRAPVTPLGHSRLTIARTMLNNCAMHHVFFFEQQKALEAPNSFHLRNSVQRELQTPEPENLREETAQDRNYVYELKRSNKLEVQP